MGNAAARGYGLRVGILFAFFSLCLDLSATGAGSGPLSTRRHSFPFFPPTHRGSLGIDYEGNGVSP